MPITDFLEAHEISQTEFGAAIGLKLPALNKKLKGTRAWKLREVSRALDFLRGRVKDETLTFEQLFGEPRPKPTKRSRRAA